MPNLYLNRAVSIDDLSRIIRVRRKELGLTQKELGEKMGIDQRTVSALEKNPSSISVSRLFLVIQTLELKLLVQTDEEPVTPPPGTLTIDQFFKNSQII